MKMLLQNAISVKYEMRRAKEKNVQISEKDAQTAEEIDRKVKHSLGITLNEGQKAAEKTKNPQWLSVNRLQLPLPSSSCGFFIYTEAVRTSGQSDDSDAASDASTFIVYINM